MLLYEPSIWARTNMRRSSCPCRTRLAPYDQRGSPLDGKHGAIRSGQFLRRFHELLSVARQNGRVRFLLLVEMHGRATPSAPHYVDCSFVESYPQIPPERTTAR